MALKARLATDAALQPLLARFVPVEIDSTSPEWQTWASRYPHEGNAIPIVYVVRADGVSLYAKSGAPQGDALPELLNAYLAEAGKLLSERELKKLSDAFAKATKAHDAGQIAEAVAIISRAAGSGSFATVAIEADQFAQKLADDARKRVESAARQLDSDEHPLEAAVELAAIQRSYKKLPDVQRAAKEAASRHVLDPAKKELFAQAALIDKAQALVEQKQPARAVTTYQQVIDKYPGTPAAALAQSRLDGLKTASEPARSVGPGEKSASKKSDDAAKRAASLLKTAKVLAKSKPDKARQLAQQVVELVPETPTAEEAAELLDELK